MVKKIGLAVGALFIGCFLFLFSVAWMQEDHLLIGEEFGTMGEILELKHKVESCFESLESRHHREVNSILSHYLFIDLSKNNRLVCHGKANEVRADRKVLAQVLKDLYQQRDHIRLVVCDVLLKDSMDYTWMSQCAKTTNDSGIDSANYEAAAIDSSLSAALDSFQVLAKLVVPAEYDDSSSQMIPLCFKRLTYGVAQYQKVFNASFYRYHYLVNDSVRSLPMVMYDMLDNNGHATRCETPQSIGTLSGNHSPHGAVSLNTITPYFRVTHDDLYDGISYYTASSFDSNLIIHRDSLIVIIGSYEGGDVHNTLIGQMTGPLILVNLYESLKHHDNDLEWWFILLTLIAYSYIGWLTLIKWYGKAGKVHDVPKKGAVKITIGDKELKILSSVVTVIRDIIYYLICHIKHLLCEHGNHFILLMWIVISLVKFHHYLYLLSALIELILLELIIGLVRYCYRR